MTPAPSEGAGAVDVVAVDAAVVPTSVLAQAAVTRSEGLNAVLEGDFAAASSGS